MSTRNTGAVPILDVRNLSVTYATRDGPVQAASDMSFALYPGENVGLVGESGCGKTTVIKSILRLLPKNATIDGGGILYKGKDLVKAGYEDLRRIRWKEIAIISQSAMNALDPVYRVSEQIVEAVTTHDKVGRGAARRRAEDLFRLVGLDRGRLSDFPHQFSGGMRQRAIIAMSLALNPSVILADEPTTALDVIVQAQILRRIADLQKELGNSMLLVTHDISVVAQTCAYVVVMYGGRVAEYGPIDRVFGEPCHPYTMGLRNAFPSIRGEWYELVSIPGFPPHLLDPGERCLFEQRCPFAQDACRQTRPAVHQLHPGHYVGCHFADAADEMRRVSVLPGTWEAVETRLRKAGVAS